MPSVGHRVPDTTTNQSLEQRLFQDFRTDERVFILIDGSNTYSAAKGLGFTINFGQLRDLFNRNTRLVRAYYFTALPPDDRQSALRRQVDWMKHNGYSVVHKQVKEYTNGEHSLMKGNVDVELTVYALQLAKHCDHLVLFTGDGDFRALVEALQDHGKRVTVVSTTKTKPPLASDDLRKQTDFFIDLADLRPYLVRPDPSLTESDEVDPGYASGVTA